jgi:hypothetical protein
LQFLLAQSVETMHTSKSAQGGQLAPPQSLSVSVPFFAPSPHPGAAHVPLGAQNAVVQPDPAVHFAPMPHGPQLPPQSTSVSSPFATASVHVAV